MGVAKVEFAIGPGPWQDALGTSTWTAAIGAVPRGRMVVRLRVTDVAGNQSNVVQRVYFAR
jgi:hypothetical protein